MKEKDLVPFKTALEKFFKEKDWSKKIKGYQIIGNWENLAGKEIAKSSRPIKIQDQCLFLAVKSNVWANELNLRKGELIEKIKEMLKTDVDLSYLSVLKQEQLESLIACIRYRIDQKD